MKKLYAVVITLIVSAVLCACAGTPIANGSSENDKPITLEGDMGITISGTWFPILNDAQGILEALGAYDELNAAPSCAFMGDDNEFVYADCYLYTNPDGDRDIWYDIYLITNRYATSRGIKVGDTLEQVMAAYGSAFYWEGDTILTYSVSAVEGDIKSPLIQFEIIDDTVNGIEIYYPTGND